MAVGKTGERVNRDKLKISIGGILVAANGARRPNYDEAPVAAHFKGRDIHFALDVGIGRGKARVWTCDLTHGYIDINADYRS
jgi:glutamate N-acetyltransferase/amino-acid N-acetyltransferase